MKSRVLLFGGEGQIGSAVQRQPLPEEWELGIFTRAECDFMKPSDIANAVQKFEPDIVINAAALTDLEECERNYLDAMEINFHAVAHIAGQCDTANAPLIHLSTDYVFDGQEGDRLYLPDDPMNPLNVFGQTKMLGEEAARHGLHWHVVVRTPVLFSAFGENILTKTLRQIDTQDEIQAETDQKFSPTSADAVAEGLITIANAILNGKGNGFGTFHLCGEPAATRFEFLQAVMESYAPYTERRPKLVPVLSSDMPDRIPQPACSTLNSDKTRDVYGIHAHDWREDLDQAVNIYVNNRPT